MPPPRTSRSSRYSPPPKTHYTVHCQKHTWISVYDGYSESSYNYYRSNSSNNCSECAKEETIRQEKLAQQRAKQTKKDEEDRQKRLKKTLENQERQRAEKKRLKRKQEREEREKKEMLERQQKEKERFKIQQEFIRASEQKMQQQIDKLKSIKTKNPYIAWRKCDTINTVKEISNQVLQCSTAGQIVLETIGAVTSELKECLQHDYKTVKPEIERYEKYGNEMKSMSNTFIKEFSLVFSETNDTKVEIDEFAELQTQAQNDGDKASVEFAKQEIELNVNTLYVAINKMKFQLLLMEQNYEKMQQDYEFFITYLQNREDEFENQKDDIIAYFDGVAQRIKKDRDVFQGTELEKGEKPKEFIEEKYDVIRNATIEKDVVIGTKTGYHKDNHATTWTIVGFIAGGLLGATAGYLLAKKCSKYTKNIMGKEKRMVNTKVEKGGSVKLSIDKQTYDGLGHARVLREIGESMKKPIDNLINEMKASGKTAKQQLEQFKVLQSDSKKMLINLNEYAMNVNNMKKILNQPNGIKDSQRKQLDREWKKISGKINGMLESMKQATKTI